MKFAYSVLALLALAASSYACDCVRQRVVVQAAVVTPFVPVVQTQLLVQPVVVQPVVQFQALAVQHSVAAQVVVQRNVVANRAIVQRQVVHGGLFRGLANRQVVRSRVVVR